MQKPTNMPGKETKRPFEDFCSVRKPCVFREAPLVSIHSFISIQSTQTTTLYVNIVTLASLRSKIVMIIQLGQSISETAALLGCSRSAAVSTYQKWSKRGKAMNRQQGHRRPRLIDACEE